MKAEPAGDAQAREQMFQAKDGSQDSSRVALALTPVLSFNLLRVNLLPLQVQ